MKNNNTNLPHDELIKNLSITLTKQVAEELSKKNFARTKEVLSIVGSGLMAMGSIKMTGLPSPFKPYVDPYKLDSPKPWLRFNIKGLKRTLERLERQKLVEIKTGKDYQTVTVTKEGEKRILKYSLDAIEIKIPKEWDQVWRLVIYDIPEKSRIYRKIIPQYLKDWGFYELQESVYLQAFPCEKEVEFLREYLRMGKYLRIVRANKIENDDIFRKYFGI